jgi:hypothetical protein
LGAKQRCPTLVYEDNRACKSFAEKTENPKKAKHYLMKVHFLQEKREEGHYEMKMVRTDAQLADIFTKPLPSPSFNKFRDWMGVVAPAAVAATPHSP